jgi:hypothetical protein
MRYASLRFALLPLLLLTRIEAQRPDATRAIPEGDVVNATTGAPISGAHECAQIRSRPGAVPKSSVLALRVGRCDPQRCPGRVKPDHVSSEPAVAQNRQIFRGGGAQVEIFMNF